MSIFAKISNRILFLVNIIVVVAFLVACLNVYINPQSLPLFSLISLTFPFLLLFLLFFGVWWLFIRKKWALLSATALVLGGGAITNFFAIHFNAKFQEPKQTADIRIASWNVARFVEMIKNNNMGSQTRYKMLKQISMTDADILCFQEFSSSINPDWYNNIVAISKGLGYPYYYFPHALDGSKLYNGNVIFSRFPIVDTGKVRFPRPTLPEAIVFADIQIGKKIVRVHTSHLQSNQFRKEDISKIQEIKGGKGNLLSNIRHIISKLSVAITHRSIQAEMMKDILDNSPYPIIFCGDLNDVPNSYTYKTVRGDLQDAFLKRGFGIGRTFSSLAPTLRIDYILADNHFSIEQFKRIRTHYSDHYMIVSDLKLEK